MFYEEGEWTPGVIGFDQDGDYTVDGVGTYIRVGKLIFLQMDINQITENSPGLGNILITGLPFVPAAFTFTGGLRCDFLDIPDTAVDMIMQIRPGSSAIRIGFISDNSSISYLSLPAISSSTQLDLSCTYITS